jgi:hypothetical protein
LDGDNTEGDGLCTTKKGSGDYGRNGPDPDDWVKANVGCCDNGDGTKELRFVVIFHEGGFGCSLTDNEVPFFLDTCNGNTQDSVAFEINLGSEFCDNCFVDKTYSFSLPENVDDGKDICYV